MEAAGCVWVGNDLNMPGSKEDIEEILRSVGAKEGCRIISQCGSLT